MDLVFYTDAIKILALFFSLVGAVLIGYGGVVAAIKVVLREVFRRPYSYNLIRRDVLTTLIAPTQEEIILLAVVVVIRTILGYFLARETVEYQLEP